MYFTSRILIRTAVLFFCFQTILSGCKPAERLSESQEEVTEAAAFEPVTAEQKAKAQAHLIRGLTAAHMDDPEQAEQHLSTALLANPSSPGINYALAEFYFDQKDFLSSIHYARRAVNLDPDNKWYRLLLANSFRATGKYRQVIHQLDAILEQDPSDLDILYMKARIQSHHGDYEKSNQTYQRLLDITGPDRSVYHQRINNYNRLNDTDAVIEELYRLLELDPANINTLLMLGQFYQDQGRIDEAVDILLEALERHPRSPETRVNLADIYISLEQWDEAGDLLDGLLSDTLVTTDNKVEIVQFMISRMAADPQNELLLDATTSLLKTLMEALGHNGLAHALAAEFYMIKDDSDRAVHHLEKTTKLLPENEAAWRQLLQSYYLEGRYDKVIETGLKAREFIPDDAFIYFFIGGAYFLKEEKKEAASWLQAASELPAGNQFRSIILGTLGDTYASLDQWESADKAYEEAIELDGDNDVALNNYAYYLSEREERLEKAWQMASRALELNPGNAAFLDTLGWIYFKMGELEKAHKYIQASIDTGSASAEVLEHMGDVYEQMEKKDQARRWWQKALDKDPERDYLKDRLITP